jgi:hypothetical protein
MIGRFVNICQGMTHMKRSYAPCRGILMILFLVACLPWLTSGCAQRTKGLFTQSELKDYKRLAVLGLTPEQEQLFMACYIKGFQEQPTTFVERTRLQEVVKEQDLLHGRLDDKTRAKIRQIFGVEALIMCQYDEGPDGQGMNKLRVRIVDSATGAITGSVIIEGVGDFESLSQQAVKALKQDLYSGY